MSSKSNSEINYEELGQRKEDFYSTVIGVSLGSSLGLFTAVALSQGPSPFMLCSLLPICGVMAAPSGTVYQTKPNCGYYVPANTERKIITGAATAAAIVISSLFIQAANHFSDERAKARENSFLIEPPQHALVIK